MGRSLWMVGPPTQLILSLLKFSCAFFTICVKNLVADQLNAMVMCVCRLFSYFSYIAVADSVSSSSEPSPLKKAQNQPLAIVNKNTVSYTRLTAAKLFSFNYNF